MQLGTIDKTLFPELQKSIAMGNMLRQFDLLRDMFSVGRQIKFGINLHIVEALHCTVAVHLVERPGRYRDRLAAITGSEHEPPHDSGISALMADYIRQIHVRWDTEDTFLLAAYLLWRFVWIHPFEDANGRTARALAYLVICLKHGVWLPGEVTVLSLIKDNASEYLATIRHADATETTGKVDLLPLALFLARLVKRQIILAAEKPS